MKDDNAKIEQRLQNMKNIYMKAGKILDELPDAIPSKIRVTLKDKILGDKDLKKLMEGIDEHRPPRLFLIGRTGVGKSSLINALCGSYTAAVSDVHSCTDTATSYQCMEGSRVLMEILDTRGLAESESLDSAVSAEEMLIEQINEFSPDCAIMMLSCTHRDDIRGDVEFLKKVTSRYADLNKIRLPVIVVVNKADEMAPARFKDPKTYPDIKKEKIREAVQYYKGIIVKNGLKIDDIIPVSSLIDWKTEDGMPIDAESIVNLPKKDIENLQMDFDGRYNIEELLRSLEHAILDFEAQMGLRMAVRLDEVIHRIANHLKSVFCTLSATVALTPIPVSDIYVLTVLQAFLVAMIASLSGRDADLDTAKEFILSLGGVAGLGYSFRMIAQQASKLLNVFWPGSGSAVSSTVAYLGTGAIADAAVSYYIDGKTIEEARKKFEQAKQQKENI